LCERIVQWVAREVENFPLVEIDIVDPLALGLPPHHDPDHPAVAALCERLSLADAFILVTPEYNHSFTASLKAVIDLVYEPWHAKPVAFVCYGGISGGLRAVEQLRLVFSELHAVTIRETVSFANPWSRFGDDGALVEPIHARKCLLRLMVQLHWWSTALKTARTARPYRGKAA
jgi:NAD(P)H-dependent FMN reductase